MADQTVQAPNLPQGEAPSPVPAQGGQPLLLLGGPSGPLELQAGQINRISAEAGHQYSVIRKKSAAADGQEPPAEVDSLPPPEAGVEGALADPVTTGQRGEDLELVYGDGTTLLVQGFFAVCQGATACSLALPGFHLTGESPLEMARDGDSHLSYYGPASPWGLPTPSLAHHSLNTLMEWPSVAQPHWQAQGNSVALASSGATAAVSVMNTITGTVTAGPVIAGHGLRVEVFQADGVTKLGESVLDTDGRFTVNVGGYTGAVIARVADASGDNDYMDEATGTAKDLNAELMAVALVTGGTVTLNINPLTAVAAIKAGAVYNGAAAVSAANVADSNTAVAAAFGLNDITGAPVAPVIDAQGNANAGANDYGRVLAALSGADRNNGGNSQTTIADLAGQITGTGASASLDAAGQSLVIAGAGEQRGAIIGLIAPRAATDAAALGANLGTLSSDQIAAISPAVIASLTYAATSSITQQDALTSHQLNVLANAPAAVAALNTIAATAKDNTATGASPDAATYATAGVSGVTAGNLAALNSALNSDYIDGAKADTAVEVQLIVNGYNAILAGADGNAANNNANATFAYYTAIGVTGIDSAPRASLLNDIVDGKTTAAVDSVPEIQALADAVAAVMAGAGGGTPPTRTQLETLGITGVTASNLAAVQTAIAATNDDGGGADTQIELQALVDNAVASAATDLAAIRDAAQNNNANLIIEAFTTPGITGVTAGNLAAINSALNSTYVDGAKADTAVEVQAIVDGYNAILAGADGNAANNNANATLAQYTAIGVTGIDTTQKARLLNDIVDGKTSAAVDSVPEIQALANAVNALMTGASGGTPPTQSQLEALGITGVTAGNLTAFQAALAAAADDGSETDTLAKIQALIAPVTGDITPPPTPPVPTLTDDVAPVSGRIAEGGATNDPRPTFSGSAEIGATVRIYDGATLIGTTAAAADGAWGFTPGTDLADGGHSITLTATDAAGNVSGASPAFTFSLVTTAPGAPAITGITDNIGTVTGAIANGGSSDDTAPALAGTLATALNSGETLYLYRDGAQIGTASVTGTGTTWTYADSGLADGVYSYTARIENAAGVQGMASGAYGIRIDTGIATPSAPVVTDDVSPVTATLANGGVTNDARPTFSGVAGSVEANATVKVYDGATLIGTTSAGANGAWTFTPATDQAGGSHSFTATATDAAGNLSSASTAIGITIDTTAPVQGVAITTVTDDVVNATGTVAHGGSTNDTTPALSGTLSAVLGAGEMVALYRGASRIGTASVNGTNWTYADSGLTNGASYSYTARVEDAAGNQGAVSAAYDIGVDTTAPAATITDIYLRDDIGGSKGDWRPYGDTTDDTNLDVIGTLSASLTAGETVRVYDGSTYLGDATLSGTNWSYADTRNNANGTALNYSARVTDAAGNQSAQSAVRNVTIAVGGSNVPWATVSAVTDDTGTPGDRITSDTSLTVSGNVLSQSGPWTQRTVHVFDGDTFLGNATVSGDGNTWSYLDSRTLVNGQKVNYIAMRSDSDGIKSGAYSVTIDTAAPSVPALTLTTDSGSSNSDGITNQARVDVGGLESGAAWQFKVDGGAWQDGTGTSFNLSAGANSYQARQTDAAGNTSADGTALGFTLDTTAPAAVAITAMTDDTGIAGDWITSDTYLSLSGTVDKNALAAGDKVQVSADGVAWADAAVNPIDGTWRYNDPAPHAASFSYRACVVDTAGNAGNGVTQAITIDAATAVPPAPSVTDDAGPVTGFVSNNGTTDDARPTFSGTAGSVEGGATVRLYDGITLIGTTTAGANGAWSFTPGADLANGSHRVTAIATDVAGNLSTSPPHVASTPLNPAEVVDPVIFYSPIATFTIDTTAPIQGVAITAVADDVNPVTGTVANGGSTNDATPLLSGTLSAALGSGEGVAVYRDGAKIGNATVSGTGWTYADNGLTQGNSYTYTARVEDAAGNQGAVSNSHGIAIDTQAPTQTATIASITDDVLPVTGIIANNGTSNDTTPLLAGALSAALGSGEVLAVYRDGARIGNASVNGTGWSYDDSGLTNGNSYAYSVRVEDAAGNQGTASAAYNISVVTVGPSAALAITALSTDTGTAGDWLTSDTTLTVSGAHGTLASGDKVQISADGGANWLDVTSNTATTWSYTDPATHGANFRYQARLVDAAGNVGTSASQAIVIDTAVPSAPSAPALTDDVGARTGVIAPGGVTDDARPGFSGVAGSVEANVTVKVYDGATLIGTTIAGADGAWTFTPATDLADGSHSFTLTASDAAGNASGASPAVTITIDTRVPGAPAITGVTDDFGPITGTVANGGITDDTAPRLTGTLATALNAGEAVALYRNGARIGTASVSGTTWSYADTSLADGSHSYTARVENAAGTQGAASAAYGIAIDAQAPALAITTSAASLGLGATATLSFSFSEAPAGFTVADITASGGTLGTLTATADPKVYTASFTATAAGAASVSVTAGVYTDAAGNSGSGNALTIPVIASGDTTPPAPPVIATVAGDDKINASEQGTTTLSGTAEAGATVTLTLGSGNSRTVTANASGAWSYSLVAADITAMGQGAETIQATATDAAGNRSGAASRIVTIDTIAPSQPTIDLITGDDIVNAAEKAAGVTFTGTAEPYSQVRYLWWEGAGRGVTTNADGVWSATFNTASVPSDKNSSKIELWVRDAAGNEGPVARKYIVIDTTPPGAPTIGQVAGDNIVNAAEKGAGVIVGGMAVANSRVEVTWGATAKTVTAAGDGSYAASFSSGEIPADAAATVISARQFDAAGNAGVAATRTVAVDTLPPAATLAVKAGQDAAITGSEAGVEIEVGYAGMQAGDRVQFQLGGALIGMPYTVLPGDVTAGKATLTVAKSSLGADGTKVLTAAVTDVAGNTGTSAPLTLAKDTPPSLVSILPSQANGQLNVAEVPSGAGFTVRFDEAVTGVAASHFSVTDASGNAITGATPSIGVSGSGDTWTVQVGNLSGISSTGLRLNLVSNSGITDGSGGTLIDTAFTGQAYAVDNSPPVAPTLALAQDTGASDGITSNGLVQVSGLETGAIWRYSTNSGSTWTTGSGGSFRLALGNYGAGQIRAEQTDTLDNPSAIGQASAIVVENASPVITAAESFLLDPISHRLTLTTGLLNASDYDLPQGLTYTWRGLSYLDGRNYTWSGLDDALAIQRGGAAVTSFTQAQLAAGEISLVRTGTRTGSHFIDFTVTDPQGANSSAQVAFYDIDSLTPSSSARPWGGVPAITYAFPDVIPNYYSGRKEVDIFQPFSEASRQWVRDILSELPQYINLTFREVSDPSQANIIFAIDKATSWGGYSWGSSNSNDVGTITGDVWMNSSYVSGGAGTFARTAIIHEIGHSLNLSHPAGTNAWGDGYDSFYSLMSYNFLVAPEGGYPATLMMDDIASLQYSYGANTTTNNGDTFYTYNNDFIRKVLTVWDTGGNDTFDFSSATNPLRLDLREGHLSDYNSANDNPAELKTTSNFGIGFGVVIENATGGSGNDSLTGNDSANRLDGGAGNDSLTGNGGLDQLIGGLGNDIFYVSDPGFRSIDGGAGTDTLRLTGARLDLTESAAGAVTGIEIIDLLTDQTAQLLRLTFSDILDMTAGATGNAALRVQGGSNDDLDLDLEGYLLGGSSTLDSISYNLWHDNSHITADILVRRGWTWFEGGYDLAVIVVRRRRGVPGRLADDHRLHHDIDHGLVTRNRIMGLQVSKTQFKAKALEFFRQIETSGEPLVVTDHGQPRLEVRPYRTHSRSPLEALRGSVLRRPRRLQKTTGSRFGDYPGYAHAACDTSH